MPILGVIASSISGNLYSASYESIQTITVGAGGASSVTFTSIPSTYKHLQIRFTGRVTTADTAENSWIRFNGDTGSNYSWHYLEGDGSGVAASGAANQNRILAGRLAAANSGTSIFSANIVDVLDYANTSKTKTIKTLGGIDRNGSGNLRMDSGAWFNTAAITSIDISNTTAVNYVEYSQFALYGIKEVS